ncbi:MAG TPA: transcriptional regulator [Cytophagales bacterium]|nr:transcriptional regulator [Cytophagales bacterium]HAA18388.1 transcriptional regulator [Cytophagales bacterium]HAP61436.1 transcriptional regulator [Cytophagales bacterium]
MKPIQMVDLKGQYHAIKAEVDQAIENVLESSAFINGPEVKAFAEEMAAYTGSTKVIPCANGTDALQIAMMALGFKPGDEIIVPTFTYVATAEVIALLGLTPVFVDVCPKTFNIEVSQIQDKITERTVGIVPVHLFGQAANMEGVMEVANKHNLRVIEDNAQAIGARITKADGTVTQTGTVGDVGTTSFFPSKNLGCYGDGGAIQVQDEALAEECRVIANHGQRKKYYHSVIGCNSRLDSVQAAILRVKLRKLDEYSGARQQVAAKYDEALGGNSLVTIPARNPRSTHVFHQYTLKLDTSINRDEMKAFLGEHKVPSMVYYPVPLHMQEAFRQPEFTEGDFPVTEALCKQVLSLPVHTEMEEEQQAYIIEKVLEFLG